ncbi:MAG: hypothetical protein HUU56_11850 [Bdellovibrionaceae bacterium]|nr:hypothetical protein [Pseudobdellovibrionaceae bacterium]
MKLKIIYFCLLLLVTIQYAFGVGKVTNIAKSLDYINSKGIAGAVAAKEICSCLFVSDFIKLGAKKGVKTCIQRDPLLGNAKLALVTSQLDINVDEIKKIVTVNQVRLNKYLKPLLGTKKTFIGFVESETPFAGCQLLEKN